MKSVSSKKLLVTDQLVSAMRICCLAVETKGLYLQQKQKLKHVCVVTKLLNQECQIHSVLWATFTYLDFILARLY